MRITPLVLLPSDRLPRLGLPPIIDLLWFRILRQVPGRTWGGRSLFDGPSNKRFGERENPDYAKPPATRIHADGHNGNRDLLISRYPTRVGRERPCLRADHHYGRARPKDLCERTGAGAETCGADGSAQAVIAGVLEQ